MTQHGEVRLRIGKRTRIRVAVEVTPGGLLAIGGLVSSVLLSTAVLVRSAGHAARDRQGKGRLPMRAEPMRAADAKLLKDGSDAWRTDQRT